MPDVTSYNTQVQEILAAIFDRSLAPPLGQPPAYAAPQPKLEGLAAALGVGRIDVAGFRAACEAAIQSNSLTGLRPALIVAALGKLGVAVEQAYESIEYLVTKGWLLDRKTMGSSRPVLLELNPKALTLYRMHALGDFQDLERGIGFSILNDPNADHSSQALSEKTSKPHVRVHAVLVMMERRGPVKLYGDIGS